MSLFRGTDVPDSWMWTTSAVNNGRCIAEVIGNSDKACACPTDQEHISLGYSGPQIQGLVYQAARLLRCRAPHLLLPMVASLWQGLPPFRVVRLPPRWPPTRGALA